MPEKAVFTLLLLKLIIIWCCFSETILVVVNSEKILITAYRKPYFQGLPEELDATKCALLLNTTLGNNISSINSRGKCINMYKNGNCSGSEFIVIAPGTPIHYDLSHWKGFDKAVNSIGPCLAHCDPKAVEKPEANKSYFATFYDDEFYKGSHLTLDLSQGCVLVPLHLKRRISSVKVEGKFCVELHHSWNCSTKFAQLRPNSPKFEDLNHWVGHEDSTNAISLCGYNCIKPNTTDSKNHSINITTTKPTIMTNTLTIYDEKYYYGNFKNLNLTLGQCSNLKDEWDGQIESIKFNDIHNNNFCIQLYDEFNCATIHGKNLTLNFTTNTSKLESLDLSSKQFERIVQSLELCHLDHSHRAESLEGQKEFKKTGKILLYIVIFLAVISISSVGVAFGLKIYFGRRSENMQDLLL